MSASPTEDDVSGNLDLAPPARKNSLRIACLPGDGIGPEVISSALSVLDWVRARFGLSVEVEQALFGGCAIDKLGAPLPESTLRLCREADAVLMGAVGGPSWDKLPGAQRPEAGLLALRRELGLFCNLRPAQAYESLLDSSPLKAETLRGTDMVVVRELTGGIYFGEPRGADGTQAWNTARYSRGEIVRIVRAAFGLARSRRRRVTSVDKANVLEVSRFWREVTVEVAGEFPDVELSHLYVDNAAMQLVRAPASFDVLVTSNLFGDVLSDLAGALTGSLGMLPSASLGAKHALYEPIHGSAPDLAGQDKANPVATIHSLALLFRHTLGRPDICELVESAIHLTLGRRHRTADIAAPGTEPLGTRAMTRKIIESLEELSTTGAQHDGQQPNHHL